MLFLGLDGAGKSALLSVLSGGSACGTRPTHGTDVCAFQKDELRFKSIEVSGDVGQRSVWSRYYENSDIIVFVIDSGARHRIEEASQALAGLLNHPTLAGTPILMWANKQDLLTSMSAAEIVQALDLQLIKDRSFQVIGCSALNKTGIREGVEWLHGIYLGEGD